MLHHAALRDGDRPGAQRALEKHLHAVARILGHSAEAGMVSGWRPQLILAAETAAGTSSPMMAAITWHLPNPLAIALATAGAVAPAITQPIAAGVRQRTSNRRLFYALGQNLERMSSTWAQSDRR